MRCLLLLICAVLLATSGALARTWNALLRVKMLLLAVLLTLSASAVAAGQTCHPRLGNMDNLQGTPLDSELLAEIADGNDFACEPIEVGPVCLCFGYIRIVDPECSIGLSQMHEDGETGVYDFFATTPGETEFTCAVSYMTDGLEQMMSLCTRLGNTAHCSAADELSGPCEGVDLSCCRIDFVRLIVEQLDIYPWGDNGVRVDKEIIWQVWGEPLGTANSAQSWGAIKSIHR